MSEPVIPELGSEESLVATIEANTRTDWRAAAWLLARRYPERWGRPALRVDDAPASPGADKLDEVAARREARRSGVTS